MSGTTHVPIVEEEIAVRCRRVVGELDHHRGSHLVRVVPADRSLERGGREHLALDADQSVLLDLVGVLVPSTLPVPCLCSRTSWGVSPSGFTIAPRESDTATIR